MIGRYIDLNNPACHIFNLITIFNQLKVLLYIFTNDNCWENPSKMCYFILFKNSCSDSQNNAFLFTFKFKTSPIIKKFQSRICVPLRNSFYLQQHQVHSMPKQMKKVQGHALGAPPKKSILTTKSVHCLSVFSGDFGSPCLLRRTKNLSLHRQKERETVRFTTNTPWSIRKHSKTGASVSVYVCVCNCMC